MRLPHPGETFAGRYSVVEELGAGGFAIVFRATDESGRTVALKILTPENDEYSIEINSRFDREVRMLGALRDPHTVRLFDHGRDAESGALFMVFEFVPGQDLDEIIARDGRLQPAVVIRVLRQLLYALREAHTSGLLHRDIKPANVRIFEYRGDPWRVKLLDFGIARPMHSGEPAITRAGELIGTPRYMSPEQLTERDLSPASDLYSLGLVGLEMLLGSDVLGGNSWGEQLDRLHTGHIFSIPEINRLGPGIVAVIQRMAARRVSDRFQSADDALDALEAAERGETIEWASDPGGSQSFDRRPAAAAQSSERAHSSASASFEQPPSPASNRRLAIQAVALLLLVGLAVGLAVWLLQKEQDGEAIPVNEQRTRPSFVRPAVGGSPDAGVRDAVHAADLQPTDVAAVSTGDAGSETTGCGSKDGAELAGELEFVEPSLESPHRYALYVPSTYESSRPYPLVVLFHEDQQTPVRILEQTRFQTLAERAGFVLLVPRATNTILPWRTPEAASHVPNLVARIGEQLCIDRESVWLVGHASGAQAANNLACLDDFASALVTVSYRPNTSEAYCDRQLPTLQFHATKGQRMPFDGGGTLPCSPEEKLSLDDFESRSKRRNGCRGKPRTVREEPTGVCTTWSCDEPLTSCRLDGGHGFPGGTRESPLNQLCDDPVADFPALDVIGTFFSSMRLR